jgi:nicotinate-nucleotide pyrophosphorylase (carboxylating)
MAPLRETVPAEARRLARNALLEDRAFTDRTTLRIVRGPAPAEATVTAQSNGVLSGIVPARAVAREMGIRVVSARRDGSPVRAGTVVLRLRGDARRILAAERTLLNFLMHASGVATATRRAVSSADRARRPLEVWATRKTLPGLRDIEKAAVVHGGGRPHRRDLSDAVLIKNNHLALVPLAEAVRRARKGRGRGERVQVEVHRVADAVMAARAGADALLVDNVSPRGTRAIVRALERNGLRDGLWVEASGGITPERVLHYRSTGVDAVSLGSITHSAPALPFHLTIRSTPRLRRRAP